MSCQNAQEQISLLLDRRLPAGQRANVLAHLETCRTCAGEFERLQELRVTMRGMATPAVPPALTTRLRIAASHYRAGLDRRRSFASRVEHAYMRMRLAIDNMMKPVAVPFAGGVVSSFTCFLFLIPSLTFQHNFGLEPPIFHPEPAIVADFTDPDGSLVGIKDVKYVSLESGSSVITGNEVSLTLVLDPAGQVQNWYVYGNGGQLTPEMKSLILYSKFIPATVSGQPAWGLKQIVYSRTRTRNLRT
jgi:hypothetical protein